MSYTGKVKNGVVVLPPEIKLPDGIEVQVTLPDPPNGNSTFLDRYKNFIGMATDLPPDLAANLDHYVHGHRKK